MKKVCFLLVPAALALASCGGDGSPEPAPIDNSAVAPCDSESIGNEAAVCPEVTEPFRPAPRPRGPKEHEQ